MEKLTCYRTKDMENDIWCEDAFIFKNSEDAEKFFTKERVAELYFDGDVSQVHTIENHGNWFAINGGGWDGIEIVEMSGGYFINAL